jgi:ribosome-associated translation inhibitor RaiA
MSEHMIFQNCTPWQKDMIRSCWTRKLPRIDKLLHHYPEDMRELRLMVKRLPDRFDVHAVLLLPTGTLVAQGSSPTDCAAINTVIDRLSQEVRRHKDVIRRDDSYRRKYRQRAMFRHAAVLSEPDIR